MPGFEDILSSTNPVGLAKQAISSGLQSAIGVYQLVRGGSQIKQANKMAGTTVRPDYRIQQGYKDNLAFTERGASQGLSDESQALYDASTDRTMGASIDAILRGGGNVNTISDIYDTATADAGKVAMLNEEVRQKNAQQYLLASEEYAQQEDKRWQINQWAPYKDRVQAIAELKAQGEKNKQAGLNSIVSAFNNGATGSLLNNPPAASAPVDAGPSVSRSNLSGALPTTLNYGIAASSPDNIYNATQNNLYLQGLARISRGLIQ